MAKDDYYVIVYKLLAYLYTRLKAGLPAERGMVKYDGELFDINKEYWIYIIRHLYQSGYIEGVTVIRAGNGEYMVNNLEGIMITPLGIDFLCNNSLFEKAKDFLKEFKSINPFI